jgi:DNA modification methylase
VWNLESKRAELRLRLGLGDAGEGKRWFKDRNPIKKIHHPTVKPIALLKKIIALFKTPNPLHVLDPFMGSGSMGIACIELGVSYTGVELDAEYYTIAQTRLAHHNTKNKSKLF